MHHIITMYHNPYDINRFIAQQGCFMWHGYSSFKREGKYWNI
jgi:hypothetical protein